MFHTIHDFAEVLATLPRANPVFMEAARLRQNILTKPPGALGRLEEIAIFMAGWSRNGQPVADDVKVVVFAGNHGVTKHNISPYPASVTQQMVANFATKGAAINAITGSLDLSLSVVPLSLDKPTADITQSDALTDEEFLEALNAGAKAVEKGADLFVFGEMGIGNTTIASALSAASFGGAGRDWAGPGTGLDAEGINHKALIIDRALRHHQGTLQSASDILKKLGGRETAAIAGAVLAARHARIPVILDGYVTCASLAPIMRDHPDALAHCLAGHLSAEPAHKRLLQLFKLKPLLDLEMRLGEGTGAALAAALVKAALATHNEMATFAEAGVQDRS